MVGPFKFTPNRNYIRKTPVYLHLTDEETALQSLRNLSKVMWVHSVKQSTYLPLKKEVEE